MDIRVKTILDFVQSKTGHEHSVIAGGSLRDETFNLEPRDYDLFVPVTKEHTMEVLAESLQKEFNVEFKAKDHYITTKKSFNKSSQTPFRVGEFTFEGKLIDLISKSYIPNDEKFGSTLVEEFDYGINMVYHDGLVIDDSNKNFAHDIYRHNMTLINLDHVQSLPKAMERYIKFRDKAAVVGMDIRWTCPNLKLSKPKKEKGDEGLKYMKIYDDAVEETRGEDWGTIRNAREDSDRMSITATTRELPRAATARIPTTTAGTNATVTAEQVRSAIRRFDERNAEQEAAMRNLDTFNPVGEIPLDDNF